MNRIFNVLAVLLLAAMSLLSQVTGRVSGVVIDPAGASIPNATVSLYLAGGTSPLLKGTTNAEGIFDFLAVRPGAYVLVVENPGFAKYRQEELTVEAARQVALPPI